VADVVALSPPRSGAPPSIFALPGPGNARAKAIWRESRSVIREGRLGVNSRPLAGGPSRPPLRAKRPKRRCSGHAEPDSFDPCSLRPSGGFSNPPPSDVLQPVEYLDSNIRTKMAVVRLLRRKWAERDEKRPETGASSRSSWFGQFARNGRSLRLSDRGSGAEKECPDRAYWRRERNCRRTLSVRRETGRW
jgi:hypothetical protein